MISGQKNLETAPFSLNRHRSSLHIEDNKKKYVKTAQDFYTRSKRNTSNENQYIHELQSIGGFNLNEIRS